MENEIKIMDGMAKIKRCKSSNIWQFSMWIKKEKKYYRDRAQMRKLHEQMRNKKIESLNSGKI